MRCSLSWSEQVTCHLFCKEQGKYIAKYFYFYLLKIKTLHKEVKAWEKTWRSRCTYSVWLHVRPIKTWTVSSAHNPCLIQNKHKCWNHLGSWWSRLARLKYTMLINYTGILSSPTFPSWMFHPYWQQGKFYVPIRESSRVSTAASFLGGFAGVLFICFLKPPNCCSQGTIYQLACGTLMYVLQP